MEKKKCSKCGEVKLVSEFHKDKNRKDGLAYWCKECAKARNKKYYEESPEKAKARSKKRYDANSEKIKARSKKWRNTNPQRVWAIATLSSHRRRGCEIQITIDELVEIAKAVKKCPICGCELAWGYGNGLTPSSPTLDRINNGQIITKETIQIICNECNGSKGARSMEKFYSFCENFIEKFRKKYGKRKRKSKKGKGKK